MAGVHMHVEAQLGGVELCPLEPVSYSVLVNMEHTALPWGLLNPFHGLCSAAPEGGAVLPGCQLGSRAVAANEAAAVSEDSCLAGM
eukprot:CAMPEP_0117685624 /NCGR_PEP_ID=MMETSP0804-20121206/21882_1 /TAXON_ID=1074897 /ORGANISM="Tetraselmis astigmatica, Strain CCMP880" /LENGTH=85 /DNA_ID=CAMNT_0005496995 /DNA_START=879 /DNA_END=1137 /DNA_ORIENTATION=+